MSHKSGAKKDAVCKVGYYESCREFEEDLNSDELKGFALHSWKMASNEQGNLQIVALYYKAPVYEVKKTGWS